MLELKQKVQHMAELEERLLELGAEKKLLEKQVFDLKIAVNNEQVDVENLEGFSVKGLLLQLTGKKEERLEEERREARSAKAEFDYAAARLANVNLQLEGIPAELEQFAGCDQELLRCLHEALGEMPCAELTAKIKHLEEMIKNCRDLQTLDDGVIDAVERLQSRLGGSGNSPVLAGVLYRAGMNAQEKLDEYVDILKSLYRKVKDMGLDLDMEGFWDFDRVYLKDPVFISVINAHCFEAAARVRNMKYQLNALRPKLEEQLKRANIDLKKQLVRM